MTPDLDAPATGDLDKLLALANAATPGPWEWDGRSVDQTVEPWGEVIALETKGPAWMTYEELKLSKDDAAFIAAARTAVPALIERVREAERIAGKRKAEACLDCIARAERAEAGAAQLREALERLFGASKNEMAARNLPLEWRKDTAMGQAESALASAPTGSRVLERLKAAASAAEVLKTWVKWWNGPGRQGYRDPVIPPLTETATALQAFDRASEADREG